MASSSAIAISAMRQDDDEKHLLPVGSVKGRDMDRINKMVDPGDSKIVSSRTPERHATSGIFVLDNGDDSNQVTTPLLSDSASEKSLSRKESFLLSESLRETGGSAIDEEESEEMRNILNKQSNFRLRESYSNSGKRSGSGSARNLWFVGPKRKPHGSGSEKDFLASEKHSDLLTKMNTDEAHAFDEIELEQNEFEFSNGVLHPEGPKYLRFLYLTIFLAIFSALVAPFNVAYLDCTSLFTPTNILMYMIDLVFLVDVGVNFTLAVYKKAHWIGNRRDIAINYLSTTFVYDLAEALPLDLILKAIYRPTGVLADRVSLVGLLRLLRLKRLLNFFWEVGTDIEFDYFTTSVVKFSALIVFFAHWAATGFYLLARMRSFDENTWVYRDEPELPSRGPWVAYLTSVYWAMTTLSTCGYGDFSAYTPEERLWASLFMLFNLALTAYVLGNMTVLLTKQDAQTASYRDKLTAFSRYMKVHKIPSSLQAQMRSHLKFHFETSEVRDDVLHQVPSTIRLRISKHVYAKWVDMSFVFRDTSQVFRDQLVSHMHVDFFMPHTTLLASGDTVNEMYIVASPDSFCEMLRGSDVLIQNGPGDCLGVFAFMCEMTMVWSVRTLTTCRMLVLGRDDYEVIAKNHSEDAKVVIRNLLERAKALSQGAKRFGSDSVFDVSTLLSREVEAYIQKQDEQTMMHLCYAAKRGDLLEVFRLISGGFDLSQTDYDGRTALHLAAAYGHTDVVRFLVEKGSPVSPLDSFYRTPLQEAVSASKWATADYLRSQGGELKLRNEGTHMCRLAYLGHIAEIEHLLHYGANADAMDYDFRTALHVATAEGHIGIVRVLLAGGAKVNMVDRWGNSALDEALRSSNRNVIQVIKENGGCRGKDLPSSGRS